LLLPSAAAERLFGARFVLLSVGVRCGSSVRSLVVSVSWHDGCSREVSLERDALWSTTRFDESA